MNNREPNIIESLEQLVARYKKQILTDEQKQDLWDREGNIDDIADARCKIADSCTAEDIVEAIEYFITTHSGLWCTDRPDLIPDNIKHLFWELFTLSNSEKEGHNEKTK